MIGVFRFLAQYLPPRNIVVVIVERQLPAQQRVEYDPQTPDIHLFARVLLALEHLRRGVTYRAAEGLQVVRLALVLAREPKVQQLHVLVLVEEYVFELEVAVHAGLQVDVGDGAHELGEGLLDFVDGELAVFEEVIVEFIAYTASVSRPTSTPSQFLLLPYLSNIP